jgi:RNA-directed DNA polymerase
MVAGTAAAHKAQTPSVTCSSIVVNETPNIPRPEYDAFKATLWNCVRLGPASQNRDGHADFRRHLEGRLAWVSSIHESRGKKLRALFERIDWGSQT